MIRIPRRHRRHLGPRFVSPNTKSIAIAIDGGAPVVTNLMPSSPACANYSTRSYTQCQIFVTTTVGSHTFSLRAYDALDGSGNLLSANTSVPVTVNAGPNPPVSIVLGGVAASLEFLLPGSVPASPTENDVYGDITFSVSVYPLDADGNMILGAGAPTVSMTPPPGADIALTQVSASTWEIASSYQSTNPLTPNSWSIVPQATPVPNSGGTTVSLPVPFSLYQPWLYVTNHSGVPGSSANEAVGTMDENGNAKTPILSSGTAFSHVPSPTGIAYDPSNTWPYIADYAGNTVCVYTTLGALIQVSGGWTGLGSPQSIAYVPQTSSNGFATNRLYVGSMTPSGSSYITAYDEQGNQQLLTGGSGYPFPHIYQPRGIAYDSNSGRLYITDNEYGPTLWEFDTEGNVVNHFCSGTCVQGSLGGITFDSGNALLYATTGPGYSSSGASSVVAFSESGVMQSLTGTFPGLNSASGITYDPYNGEIYVVDHGANKVFAYDEQGNLITSFSSQGTGPVGIAVVP